MSFSHPLQRNNKRKPTPSGFRRRLTLGLLVTVALLVLTTSVLASLSFLTKWGTTGAGDGQFLTPNGIGVDSTGNVYVSEGNGPRSQVFDSNGTFLDVFGVGGDVPGGFVSPSGITVASSGNIYVSDSFTDKISKFDNDGNFLLRWGGTGSGNGQFLGASGVAVDSAGNVYASDTNNHRIQKFTSTGTFISSWGSSGAGNGQFFGPQGLAIDASDNVYVADTGNNRIQKFTSTGTFVTKWGTLGSGNGQFTSPGGVSAALDNVYVADSGNNRIQAFTDAGGFLEAYGTSGTGDGQFSGPQDVAADAFGNVFVADTGNDRVQKLGTAATTVVADAGANQTVECAGDETQVTLNGSGSTGGGTLTYTWTEGATTLGTGAILMVSLPSGSHTITLTVESSEGGSDDDTVTVNITDTEDPSITLVGPNPMTVECSTAFVDPGATASDDCAGDLTASIIVTGSVDPDVVGSYVLNYSVSDGTHTVSVERTVNVVDTTAPVITLNGQSPAMWSPNHQYETFSVTDFVTSVTDSCATSLGVSAVVISKVTSDELENGGGDGTTFNDIVIAPDCRSVQLRSERHGGSNGRVYTITFRVVDASGNSSTATATVTVPHSQAGGPAIADGPLYTVLGSCP